MSKKRIGENKRLLPLPRSNLPLKLMMQAAKKIKKKYFKMAYPKLSLREKEKKEEKQATAKNSKKKDTADDQKKEKKK